MDVTFFLKLFAALFAIVNPIANLPVFLSLTSGRTPAGQRNVAATLSIALAVGVVVVGLAGKMILDVFGIGIDDFRLAGGFLILLIALHMVNGGSSSSHSGTEEEKAHHEAREESPAIYPLTVPILLGPGTIATLIIFREHAADAADKVAYWAAAGATVALLAATFFAAPYLGRMLGQTATSIMSRLMGMILAAIAMEMMIDSLKSLLPGLAG